MRVKGAEPILMPSPLKDGGIFLLSRLIVNAQRVPAWQGWRPRLRSFAGQEAFLLLMAGSAGLAG
eukprot:8078276-Heterocapsa_arctica.AAC.1